MTVVHNGEWSPTRLLVGLAAALGLCCIVISTDYAQRFELRTGPLPFEYPWTAIGAFVTAGMLLTLAVMARPRLFWPLMIVTSTATGGMFVLGFPIFDEWLAGCLVLGAVLVVLRGAVPIRKGGLRYPGVVVFLLFAAYMLMQATVGFIAHGPKAIRFVLLYGVILLTGFLLAMYQFPLPTPRTISLLLASSASAYFALYVLHGLLVSDFLTLSAFREMEGIGGAGTAYAAFPIVVAIPAAMLLLRDERGLRRGLALVTLGLAIAVALLAQSRAAVVALGAFCTVAPLTLDLKTSLKALAALAVGGVIVLAALGLDIEYLGRQYESIIEAFELQAGARVLSDDTGTREFAKGDAQRHLMNAAAFRALYFHPLIVFFGSGIYGYWSTAGAHVEALREDYDVPDYVMSGTLLGSADDSEPPRPPSWPALLVESGVLGVGLLIATMLLLGFRALGRSRSASVAWTTTVPYLVLISILLIIAWGYFAEIQDYILVWVMLMPFGVLDRWTDTPTEALKAARNAVA